MSRLIIVLFSLCFLNCLNQSRAPNGYLKTAFEALESASTSSPVDATATRARLNTEALRLSEILYADPQSVCSDVSAIRSDVLTMPETLPAANAENASGIESVYVAEREAIVALETFQAAYCKPVADVCAGTGNTCQCGNVTSAWPSDANVDWYACTLTQYADGSSLPSTPVVASVTDYRTVHVHVVAGSKFEATIVATDGTPYVSGIPDAIQLDSIQVIDAAHWTFKFSATTEVAGDVTFDATNDALNVLGVL